MNLDPKTILQVLVLAVGAHIVLSFLRTSREAVSSAGS